jgi:hypothetical protein
MNWWKRAWLLSSTGSAASVLSVSVVAGSSFDDFDGEAYAASSGDPSAGSSSPALSFLTNVTAS